MDPECDFGMHTMFCKRKLVSGLRKLCDELCAHGFERKAETFFENQDSGSAISLLDTLLNSGRSQKSLQTMTEHEYCQIKCELAPRVDVYRQIFQDMGTVSPGGSPIEKIDEVPLVPTCHDWEKGVRTTKEKIVWFFKKTVLPNIHIVPSDTLPTEPERFFFAGIDPHPDPKTGATRAYAYCLMNLPQSLLSDVVELIGQEQGGHCEKSR